MSESAVCMCLPKSAETLWKEYVIKNGQSAITPGEIPEQETCIISVNYVKILANGQAVRVFNTRVLCKNYQDMMNKKYQVDGLIDPSHQERRIDHPRHLAKTVTVE